MKNKNILSKKKNKFQLLAVCRFWLYPEKTRKSFLPGPIWTHIWWWWWWRGALGVAQERGYIWSNGAANLIFTETKGTQLLLFASKFDHTTP